jgi:predicted lipid-binding transport protein (Tim44 family)
MNRSILKPIIGGVLFGAALFFIPFFLLRVAAFFIIAGIIFRIFAGKRRFGSRFRQHRLALADNIRNMSEAEYEKFRNEIPHGCGPRTQQDVTIK